MGVLSKGRVSVKGSSHLELEDLSCGNWTCSYELEDVLPLIQKASLRSQEHVWLSPEPSIHFKYLLSSGSQGYGGLLKLVPPWTRVLPCVALQPAHRRATYRQTMVCTHAHIYVKFEI